MSETQCEYRDAVGQRCLRPGGHSAHGGTVGGHDFGGVTPDHRSRAEWSTMKVGQTPNTRTLPEAITEFLKDYDLGKAAYPLLKTEDITLDLLRTKEMRAIQGALGRMAAYILETRGDWEGFLTIEEVLDWYLGDDESFPGLIEWANSRPI